MRLNAKLIKKSLKKMRESSQNHDMGRVVSLHNYCNRRKHLLYLPCPSSLNLSSLFSSFSFFPLRRFFPPFPNSNINARKDVAPQKAHPNTKKNHTHTLILRHVCRLTRTQKAGCNNKSGKTRRYTNRPL